MGNRVPAGAFDDRATGFAATCDCTIRTNGRASRASLTVGVSSAIGAFDHCAAGTSFTGRSAIGSYDRATFTHLSVSGHSTIRTFDNRATGMSTRAFAVGNRRTVGSMPHVGIT
jgi:hypothetical protein